MIKRIIHTALLLMLGLSMTFGQETISADNTSACDSLRVTFTLNTTLQLSDYTSVVWDFGDGGTAENALTVTHLYTKAGSFNVKCTLNGETVISESRFINVFAPPHAEFVFKDSSLSAEEFRYFFRADYFVPEAGDLIDYEWEFPDGSTVLDSTTFYTFPAEGIYEIFLMLTDENGCVDSLRRKIPVSRELMVPNVFSPNGDNLNDYFEVTTQGDNIYNFRVFTRTGTQVHYSRSPRISWDGRTTGGTEVPEGVYYYVIESDGTLSPTRLSGFIHLYR